MNSFLRYNQIPKELPELSDKDEVLYSEFVKKLAAFRVSLEEEKGSPSTIMGSLMSMFGFNRHYCSMSGLPIIGKYYKIGGKIVSQEAHESYRIIQQMEGLDKDKKEPATKTKRTKKEKE